ncbi:MAG: DUF192 domain-containing protein [Myxococcales bacterium]|nr:DUF192 domain-containing protein [Myxococcales bacterium]
MLDRTLAVAGLALLVVLPVGCADPDRQPCAERAGVAEPLSRATLTVREAEVSAELARTESERASAWVDRRCDLDGLLWIPDEVGTVSIGLCRVQVAVDLALLREGRVVGMERDRAPCDGPCDACPLYGDDGPEVDAVLWLLAGEVEIEVGDAIGGLDEVDLPAVDATSTG